jgi:hypothetical protein
MYKYEHRRPPAFSWLLIEIVVTVAVQNGKFLRLPSGSEDFPSSVNGIYLIRVTVNNQQGYANLLH